ncbi:Myosin-binding protein 7 [Striga hermonthica]|uniref:Myosin-binding protein 7 n=1 Tax=Striga hermonthica TaxID=68872 RepID=A0A9N7NTJ5_STRHE|nr:Myosin-binding protein 7 [Striga hermonthica]
MELENPPTSISLPKFCNCGCNCSSSTIKRSFSETHLRTVKRKYNEFEEESRFTIPGFIFPQNARVEIWNECTALREMVSSQQKTIQDLISELEEERNASSSAANEAMSMILRLQREKAEIQLEARQFKMFAEERIAHDQHEALALEDLLYKRDQAIMSLTCAVQAYRHRMMSYGLTEAEADEDGLPVPNNSSVAEVLDRQFEFPPYDYPPLRCMSNESRAYPDGENGSPYFEKYVHGETPCSRNQLKDLEYRINQLERSPKVVQLDGEFSCPKNVLEKVIVGHSPRTPKHLRKLSADSLQSPFAVVREIEPDFFRDSPKSAKSFRKGEFSYIQESSNLGKAETGSDAGDDMSDRIYTIDSVFQRAPFNRLVDSKTSFCAGIDECAVSPKETLNSARDIEIQKLYARLHALEADRESMRQAIISIGTDKAQVLLLKEMALNLCKERPLGRKMPVRKESVIGSFFFMSFFKWILPIFFWRRKSRKCRYMFGLSDKNTGLLLLLERDPRVGIWRCVLSTAM